MTHPHTQAVRVACPRLDEITAILHNADAAVAQAQTPEARTGLAAHLDAQAEDAEAGTITDKTEPARAAQLRADAAPDA